jgi:hypothetical protein
MYKENKFEKCEPDDPNRCQSINPKVGQCYYKAFQKEDGTYYNYCVRHLAAQRSIDEKQKVRNYRLNKFQSRLNEFADNDQIKSLREEVGIARMLLEEIINMCSDSTELIMASNRISDLVTRIEKLVTACNKLEQSAGLLLDKTTLLGLADVIVEIIGKHIVDEDIINSIALEIVKCIGSVKNEDSE